MSSSILGQLMDQVCARSEGNPGALNVMCAGIVKFGWEFHRRIVRADLRGSQIWCVYKDDHGCDIVAMFEALIPKGTTLMEWKE